MPPQEQSKFQTLAHLILLIENLTPIGVGLVLKLADRLQGVPDEEIVAQSNTIFDEVIATARAEKAKLDTDVPPKVDGQ